MRQYPAYPEYKPTGCDWFPEIPSHWEIDRAKWSVTSCQNGVWGAEPDGIDDLVCIRVADFDRQSLRVSTENLTMRSIAEKDRRNRLLRAGDLLLEKSGGGENQLVGAVIEFDQPFPAVSSNFIARMVVSDDMSPRFLVYLHSHLHSSRVNFRSIKQTTGIQNLDSQSYLNEPITYPPLEEQEAIARFLDFKTAQMDALIVKQKVLLDLLVEKRNALISHAVTKGLDRSVSMKDSGVAWLGMIPEHWMCPPLYSRYTIELGKMLDESRISGKYLVPYLRNVDVQWDRINTLDLPVMDIQQSEYKRYLVQPDDLLVCEGGEVGRAAIVGKEVNQLGYQKALHRLRPVDAAVENTRFLFYQLCWAANSGLFLAEGNPNTIPHLTGEKLRRYRFPCPPIDEQKDIANRLDDGCERIAQQRQTVEAIIDRLQEYRAGLITNAVTGRIDVRGFKIPQPPEDGGA